MADGRLIVAMKARELGKGSVVVGDRVALAGDTSGAKDSLARIVRVEPRTSALRRSPDDTDPTERIIVANADQLVIVCALASPEPRLRFIDRCLVAAYDAGLDPLLLLTKADLASPRKIRAFYTPLGVPMLTTRRPLSPRTLSQVRKVLTGRLSVLIGQSGVGKSTLVNTLVPEAARSVGSVNPVTGRGRHTSSSAVALPLGDGWLIDTPGLRGFGLGHVSPERVVEAFGDLAEGTVGCPSGCDHLSPGCALDEWAREHHAEARLDSLRRVLRSREGGGAEDLTGGLTPRLVGEVLGHPDGTVAVDRDGDADVGERGGQDVQPVTVVRGLLVQHVLGQGHCHVGDGRRGVRDRTALADVLPGRGPVHAGCGFAVAQCRLTRALVRQAAARLHGGVVHGRAVVQPAAEGQRGQARRCARLVDQRKNLDRSRSRLGRAGLGARGRRRVRRGLARAGRGGRGR
jgi:ribosome biogenesis GTPase / thiamine phosphate phosphatase